MKINNIEIGGASTYFVIEEGQANLGNFEVALKMIDAASNLGAQAIEFQLAEAEDFYIKSHKGYEIYKEREFTDLQLQELVAYTTEKGLDLVVAPLGTKLIEKMVLNGCAAFNINASDLTNPDIIDRVAEAGKPFFLSLLLAEEKEIDWAVNRIYKKGSPEFGLLLGQHTMASGGHGVSLEHTNLGYISTLKQKYNVPVGFIDHSPQIWMPACAVAAGADVITKHLAISREDKGPDWQVCLEPDEMKESIQVLRDLEKSLNSKEKTLAPGEDMDKTKMRRSIVSAREIREGEVIRPEDIVFKRPGTGISSLEMGEVVGRKVKTTIEKDTLILFSDLD